MTETLFGLIPSFGLIVVFAVVALACLAVPLPASALVLATGGFAAAGDLSLSAVFGIVFSAFVLGDQLAFGLANMFGPRLLGWLAERSKPRSVLEKGQEMVEQHGVLAVFLSHTILSPSCPYVSYACGAGGMRWLSFTIAATIGAAIWTAAYMGLGYAFARQLSQVSEILGQFFILAGALLALMVFWKMIRRRWRMIQLASLPADS